MTTVITSPMTVRPGGLRIFLGGAIEMGRAPDWQAAAIESLRGLPGLVLLNPRRPTFAADSLEEQIRWELAALELADYSLFWFPARTIAPIALLEVGLYAGSDKILVGADPAYSRRLNLQLALEGKGVPLLDSLDDLLSSVTQLYCRWGERTVR
jgi:hypothetical protein